MGTGFTDQFVYLNELISHIKQWLQIWELNPILGAYEARDLTACPICNNVSGERFRPSLSPLETCGP